MGVSSWMVRNILSSRGTRGNFFNYLLFLWLKVFVLCFVQYGYIVCIFSGSTGTDKGIKLDPSRGMLVFSMFSWMLDVNLLFVFYNNILNFVGYTSLTN